MQYYTDYTANGYSDEQAFYLAEIKTTQKILNDLQNLEQYNPTLLLNSLLTLIVLPYEKGKTHNQEKMFSLKYKDFGTRMNIIPNVFQPIKSCDNGVVKYANKTTTCFINKLRNGIAHQNISVSIIDRKDFSITIKNKYSGRDCSKCKNPVCKEKGVKREKGGVIDFEITVSVAQLKRLADYIANSYLKVIERGE